MFLEHLNLNAPGSSFIASSVCTDACGVISVDLVLQVRAQMGDNNFHEPEDNVECELIKLLPLEKFYLIARCYQERLRVRERVGSQFLDNRQTFFLRERANYIILRLEKENELQEVKQLNVGGIHSLQVMMTQLLQKHGEWQEDRRKNMWHGSERELTMYVASMIKTALDVVRPKHIAEFVCDEDVHGWVCGRIAPRDSWFPREEPPSRMERCTFSVLQFQRKIRNK